MIFGTFSRSGDQRYIEGMIALSKSDVITQYIPADKKGQWRDDKVALVQHTIWNTRESLSDQCPTVANDGSGLVMTTWARIDNREELGRKLGINPRDESISDSFFILESYKKWGEDCVLHLIGDFVFVIYDQREQKVFCARDHMGVRPFYYHLSDQHFIFASGLNVFVQLPGFEPEKSQKWMAEYMVGLSMNFTDTAYTNIQKLAPAHCLTISKTRNHLRQYFKFSPETSLKLKDSQEYVDCYREQLKESIRCRLRSDYNLGVELSGGLDSSSIAAFTTKMVPAHESKLHAFGFTAFEYEADYIEKVSQYCKLSDIHILEYANYTSQQYNKMVLDTIDILGYPVEHQIAIGHMPVFDAAVKMNVRTLLSGFGGDEFVTNPANIVLAELVSQWRVAALYKSLSGGSLKRVLRVLNYLIRQYVRSDQFNSSFHSVFLDRWKYQVLDKKLVTKYHLYKRYMQSARYESGYKNLNQFILENRWLPFVTTRMENCSLMAAASKLEYAWPLLDVRLIKLYISIPSAEKYKNGIGRFLHRQACVSVLPDKLVWKNSKFMGKKIDPANNMNMFLPDVELVPEKLRIMVNIQKLESQYERVNSDERLEMTEHVIRTKKNLNSFFFLTKWFGIEKKLN